eukprot:m.840181 g.840181  ORF g.840181 m.840181 type:complete len:641 (+) comp59508_c0_seq9:56-1978(+)
MGCCAEDQESKTVARGPLHERVCRDVIWAIVFLAFWVGMLIIGGIAIQNGHPRRLVYGEDSFGNLCGTKNDQVINSTNSGLDLTARPLLFYFDPTDSAALKLCVAECPSTSTACACSSLVFCTCYQDGLCLNSQDNTYQNIGTPSDTENNGCPQVIYKSSDPLNIRRCIPDLIADNSTQSAAAVYDAINNSETLQQIISDFYSSRWAMLIGLGVAIALSMLMALLMRCFTGPVVYLFLLGSLVGMIAVTVYAWRECLNAKKERDDLPSGVEDDQLDRNVKLYQAGAIILTIAAILFFCLLVVMRNRIRFVIALFEETSIALMRLPQLFLLPATTTIFLAMFFAFWLTVYIFLASTGSPVIDSNGHVAYEDTPNYQKMWWYYIFGLFWGGLFPIACQDLVLASCIATWYYTRNKAEIRSPITAGIWRLIRYHLGSVALGSFLIALVKFIRFVLLYIQAKLKHKTGRVVQVLLKCLSVCFWCLEKILKFIAKNAYIEIAIYGYSFCHAARVAFQTLFANVLRVATLNSLGTFVIFLAKLTVVSLVGVFMMYYLEKHEPSVQFPALIVVVVCVFSYFIASTIMTVYRMAVDTLLLCFCEDSANNKSAPYASERLQNFMSEEERRNREAFETEPLLDAKATSKV